MIRPEFEEFAAIVDRGQLISVADEFAAFPDQSRPSELVQVERGVLTWEIWR